ncbi:tRNA 2'-phosphotransferase 1 isoform X2 [Drosophila yakuba]|uniref:tRNA 2'-phosphotransferase 1 isoform X2 n=1 Tax=Drosophila yakuba TaxID=7245 RepID=UPI00017DBF61|nr:tRNA 2'-phosphotransferase 1 isoform X2 [Drosophila yakuba]
MAYKRQIDTQMSKKLSWLLRHGAKTEGIPIRADGFVSVPDLQKHPRYKSFTLEKLKEIAAVDAKQRYTLRWNPELRVHEIRANQGHSLAVVEGEAGGLERIMLVGQIPLAVHGTYHRHWESIRSQGLRRMNRNHVHFASSDETNSTLSGFRSDCQILIYLNVEKVLADGVPIYRSSNNVLLCPGIKGIIHSSYFQRVVDRKTGQPLTY